MKKQMISITRVLALSVLLGTGSGFFQTAVAAEWPVKGDFGKGAQL